MTSPPDHEQFVLTLGFNFGGPSRSHPFAPPLKLTASINVSKRDFKGFKQIQAEMDTHKIGLYGMPRSLLKWQA